MLQKKHELALTCPKPALPEVIFEEHERLLFTNYIWNHFFPTDK